MGNLSIQSISTSKNGTLVPETPAGAQPKSNPSKPVPKTNPSGKSAYRKAGVKLDPKLSTSGSSEGNAKSGRSVSGSFACRIFQPLQRSKIQVQSKKGSANPSKAFSRNLIYTTSQERKRIHAQAVKDAKVLLTKKDGSGQSLKTRLYDMLVRHWTRTGQTVMEYPQFEKYLHRAMQTKINWLSNHYWKKVGQGCGKDPCKTVEKTFQGMSPNTLGVGGVVENGQIIRVSKKQCAKTGPCVRSSDITLTTQTPIISVRDNGFQHPNGLAQTVAHEFLHVFFRISGALNNGNEDHGFTRRLGLGGTDDSPRANPSHHRP